LADDNRRHKADLILTLARYPVQSLRNGINLVVILSIWESKKFGLEIVEPRGALGKEVP